MPDSVGLGQAGAAQYAQARIGEVASPEIQAKAIESQPVSINGGNNTPLSLNRLNTGRSSLQQSALTLDTGKGLDGEEGSQGPEISPMPSGEQFESSLDVIQQRMAADIRSLEELQEGAVSGNASEPTAQRAPVGRQGVSARIEQTDPDTVMSYDRASSLSLDEIETALAVEIRGLEELQRGSATAGSISSGPETPPSLGEGAASENASDPTTQRALVERQSLSAQAGLRTFRSLIKEAGLKETQAGTLNKGLDLLAIASKATPETSLTSMLSPDELAKAKESASLVNGASADPRVRKGVRKRLARLHHRTMQDYLGVKHSSNAEKKLATQVFLQQLDDYLEGDAQPPTLTGPDRSESRVLTPDEKVSLVIAHTMKKAGDNNTASLSRKQKTQINNLVNPRQVCKRVARDMERELRAEFKPVTKTLSFPGAVGKPGTYQSELKPACHGAGLPDYPRLLSENTHPFGEVGVLCTDADSVEHVPNLWSADYKGPEGKTLFHGVRHGVLSAFGFSARRLKALPESELHALINKTLSDKLNGPPPTDIKVLARKMTSRFSFTGYRLRNLARNRANRSRANELVIFNLLHNDKVMKQIRSGENEVKLKLPSIMLQTPDRARHLLAALSLNDKIERNNELRMVREQHVALKELDRDGDGLLIPMQVKDENGNVESKVIRVYVEPLVFSIPVNELVFGGSKIKRLNPVWGNADAISRSSIERLVGKDTKPGEVPTSGLVADYLAEKGGNMAPEEKEIILQLTDQIVDIWQNKAHHGENNEPYALPARLALLVNKLGITPSYNCKSGKDRTGQLDAEIKYLATQIDQNGRVPRPGADLEEADRAIYRTIVLGAGNHEIQRVNTGHGGYKVKLPSITRRLGDVLAQLKHMGQGKFTSA